MAAAQVAQPSPSPLMLYQHEAFQTLPGLHQAADTFKEGSLEDLLQGKGAIRDFFLKHNIYKDWGIVLLHKHFNLEPDHRLVEFGYVSTPWRTAVADNAFTKYGGLVVPRSYMVLEGKFIPFEFAYMPGEAQSEGSKIPDGLIELLRSLEVDQILGLRSLEGRQSDFNVEVTEHNANIMVPRGCMPDDILIPAVWIFDPEDEDRCNCREYCSKESWGHVKTHGCG